MFVLLVVNVKVDNIWPEKSGFLSQEDMGPPFRETKPVGQRRA